MKDNQSVCENVVTIKRGFDMYFNMCRLMAILEKVKTISRVELDKLVDFPINTMMQALIAAGKVKEENRKEEHITTKKGQWTYHDKYDMIVPATVVVTINGEDYTIPNPEITRRTWAYIEKEIQVTRKYYTWVG